MTGPELRDLRRRMGMTQGQLAALLGKAPPRISEWENNRRAIPLAEVRALRDIARDSGIVPPTLPTLR